MLLHFLTLKGYISKQEHSLSESVSIRLRISKEIALKRFERRIDIAHFIVDRLNAERDNSRELSLVNFSLVGLLQQFIQSRQQDMFSDFEEPALDDIEELPFSEFTM